MSPPPSYDEEGNAARLPPPRAFEHHAIFDDADYWIPGPRFFDSGAALLDACASLASDGTVPDALPVFGPSGKFVGYEARAMARARHDPYDGAAGVEGGGDPYYEHRHRKRRLGAALLVLLAMMASVATLALFLTRKSGGDSVATEPSDSRGSTDYDLFEFGYDHVHESKSSAGRTSWPSDGSEEMELAENELERENIASKSSIQELEEDAGSDGKVDTDESKDEGDAPPSTLRRIIQPSALATITKSSPDSQTGGMHRLSVEGEARVSFVRFDLNALSADDVVSEATLRLYLTTPRNESCTIVVAALPHSGHWSEGAVSWNAPVEERGAYRVGAFEAREAKWYEVDVTKAIHPSKMWRTFMISTEDEARVNFAGKAWKGGAMGPELTVILSD